MRQMLPDGNCARRKCAPRRTLFHDTPVGRESGEKTAGKRRESPGRQEGRLSMRKRRLWMAAALTFTVLLAGCGSKEEAVQTEAASTAAAAAEETEAADAKETEAAGEAVTLRVVLWDYSNTQYYKIMFEAFMAEYPNITIEPVEFSADEYDNVIVTQLSGKQNFDVVFTKNTPALSALIAQGHILALDDLIAADTEFDAAGYAGLMDEMALDGKTYALPFRYDNNLIFYNKDLFDAAGVEYPKDGMTMAEYHALAAQMTSGEGNEKVYGAHFHTWPSNIYEFPDRTEEFNMFEPDTYDSLISYYNEAIAMQDEGVIQDYGALKASNIHYSGVFYNQQAAMMQMGTWFINMLLENVQDFSWGVCTLPNDIGMVGENCIGGVTPVSIGAYGEHPEEAWQFIRYICGEEGAKVLAATGIVPGYSSDAIAEIYNSFPETYPNTPENLADYIICEKNVIEVPLNAHGKEVDTVFQEQHSAIMTKSVTVEEGIQQMKDRVNEILAAE